MKFIYCAGDQGRVVVDILRAADEGGDLRFVDDDKDRQGKSVAGVPVVKGISAVDEPGEQQWLVAFGGQNTRLTLAEKVGATGASFFNAVHPSATISDACDCGAGVTVNAESYIGPGATLKNHVLVDSCVNVSHDVTLSRGATVTPNATLAGDVSIGSDAYIGPGATVVRGTTVESGAVIGAGAVVVSDVPADTTVVGVPASEQGD